MRNLFIVDIEPLDGRYTKQWESWIPELANKHMGDKFNIIPITGNAEGYNKPQSGAFFDFASTCEYKASQAVKISRLFQDGKVNQDDVFFFTDAWNQTIHYVKYISELTNIKVNLAGIFHAGWYDPTDILGYTIKNSNWAFDLERSYYHALDMVFFGTQQHLDKFHTNLDLDRNNKSIVCGYPLEYIKDLSNNNQKENIVVFPHRLNDDKAPWIFDSLEKEVQKTRPDIRFVKTQEQGFSKDQYYNFLKTCKVVFSANKHENLGIGTFEAMTAGCLPIVPDKLSYQEMYSDRFKYKSPDDLYDNFEKYKILLADLIVKFIDNYEEMKGDWEQDVVRIQEDFFSGTKMLDNLKLI